MSLKISKLFCYNLCYFTSITATTGGVSSSLKAATQGRFARHNSFSGCIWDIYNPYKSVESFTLSDIAITGRNARSCPVREKASLT